MCTSDNLFDNQVYANAILTVPTGCKKAYRQADVWKLFHNIQAENGGFKVSVAFDGTNGHVALNGVESEEIIVDEEEQLTVSFLPDEGYEVTEVTVNGTDVTGSLVDNKLSYESIDSNMAIDVTFSIITFALNVPAELTGGHILVNDMETVPGSIDYGCLVEIAAVPERGYKLAAFSVNGIDLMPEFGESGVYVIEKVTSDIVVNASFSPIVYTIKAVNNSAYGTLTLNGNEDECMIEFGKPLVIRVTPKNEGCFLRSLTIDDKDVTSEVSNGVYTVESVESDMIVAAEFGINTYDVSFSCDSSRGTIVAVGEYSGHGVTVEYGATMYLNILPAEGFEIESVTLDGDDVTDNVDDNGMLTIENIRSNHHVEAVFAVRRVKLTVLGLNGGTIAMRYDYGTPVTLIVASDQSWKFHSLTVGEDIVTELEEDDSYTIPAIIEDTAVSVVFVQDDKTSTIEKVLPDVTVSAKGHTISVDGVFGKESVEIYDTAGLLVYKGTDHEITLNRDGVFIVRVCGLSFKVILR